MSDIFTVISDLRAELATAQAEIVRLKVELAETWQPVSDGHHDISAWDSIDILRNNLTLTANGCRTDMDLPANLRLCRKAATVAAE